MSRKGDLPRPPRVRVNLFAKLSPNARVLLGLMVAAAVFVLAWFVGRDQPVPQWIEGGLVPALGWIYLILLGFIAMRYLRRRKGRHGRSD